MPARVLVREMRCTYLACLSPNCESAASLIDYVEANIGETISLDDLAQVAGLSRFYFGRSFHNALGEPPTPYLARRRLEAAKRLLRMSDLSMPRSPGSPVAESQARSPQPSNARRA